ncbi:MAG: type II toxin-antitoxin system VapC family toxin [Candidatus Sulfotelmatobacter sp.]
MLPNLCDLPEPDRPNLIGPDMIGLDTNVLVRFLTHDDPVQTPAAIKLMRSLSSASPGFVSLVVIAELSWVLKSLYNFERSEMELVLENLLRSDALLVERSEIVWQALRKFKTSNAGFSDCLVERSGHAAVCIYTATFDKRAVATGMRLLEDI